MVKQVNSNKPPSSKALSAVTRVFVENSAYLHTFLRRFLQRQQDIEDVAQEAYLKAFSAEQGKDIEYPKTFLFTIAKNIAINEISKKSRQITDYIEECKTPPLTESSATAENELEAQQSLGIYCEAVAALPEQCRRVYLLSRVQGLKQKEIAESLGISLRAVQKHLASGVSKCSAFITEKQHDGAEETKGINTGVYSHKGGKL